MAKGSVIANSCFKLLGFYSMLNSFYGLSEPAAINFNYQHEQNKYGFNI
jgi:hypothetical protein